MYLESEDLRLNERQRSAVDLDETVTGLNVTNPVSIRILAKTHITIEFFLPFSCPHLPLSALPLGSTSGTIPPTSKGGRIITDLSVCDSSGCLLLAEALDALGGRHGCG